MIPSTSSQSKCCPAEIAISRFAVSFWPYNNINIERRECSSLSYPLTTLLAFYPFSCPKEMTFTHLLFFSLFFYIPPFAFGDLDGNNHVTLIKCTFNELGFVICAFFIIGVCPIWEWLIIFFRPKSTLFAWRGCCILNLLVEFWVSMIYLDVL